MSFDLPFLFRPAPDRAVLADAVILNMDEDSRESFHQPSGQEWERTVYAKLIRALTARGAKVVVFDVLFDDPSPDPAADVELGAAIRGDGRVVLGTSVLVSRSDATLDTQRLLRPLNAIGTNASWGVVELNEDFDRSIRRQFTYVDKTNLAWQAAVAFDKAPADRLTKRWLNFYGPGGTLATESCHLAVETNRLPSDFFKGKAVFVGKSQTTTWNGTDSDQHPTPFSRGHRGETSGVELHATAFLNLIHADCLEELSPLVELLLFLLTGVLFGSALTHLRPLGATGLALLGAVLVGAGSVALVWGLHRWFPWLIICAVQIPCALGWSVLMYTTRLTRQKEALERNVALAESVASLPALLPETELKPSDAPTVRQATRSSEPPQRGILAEDRPPAIPNHELLRRIGRGAYGEVWLAKDEIGSYHAVKVVYQRTFQSAAPYEREFRGIQKFTPISRSHPGFIHILHVGRSERYFFYIMELGDDAHSGQQIDPETYSPNTLAHRIEAQRRIPLPECVQLGLDLTTALESLHHQHLIHRDIKPSNIIFVNRAPKFADVGLVTGIVAEGKQGTFVGTEGYIAPEGPGTPRADVYSLGKVLYEACTGRDRMQFPSLSGTLITSGPRELTMLNEIILKACDPNAKNRYQTAAQLHADLLSIQQRFGAG